VFMTLYVGRARSQKPRFNLQDLDKNTAFISFVREMKQNEPTTYCHQA
jgi:hypothetical protein